MPTTHVNCDGHGRALGCIGWGGQIADTITLLVMMDRNRVHTAARSPSDRVGCVRRGRLLFQRTWLGCVHEKCRTAPRNTTAR